MSPPDALPSSRAINGSLRINILRGLSCTDLITPDLTAFATVLRSDPQAAAAVQLEIVGLSMAFSSSRVNLILSSFRIWYGLFLSYQIIAYRIDPVKYLKNLECDSLSPWDY
jgi:hypothetical protein